MAKYLENILMAGTRKATAVQTSSNASIGLVVKKYWNKMIQIFSVVQKLQAEVINQIMMFFLSLLMKDVTSKVTMYLYL